ncbi:MAG: ATP-binding protein [Promethearchaeota archaeon]
MGTEEQYYARNLEEILSPYFSRKEIIGIRGARQIGKTTLLKRIQDLWKGESIFINMDLRENRRSFESSPLDFVARFTASAKGISQSNKFLIIFDEIQRITKAGELLKIVYDEANETSKVKIFISGSSSLELKTNVLPFLAGRLLLFNLFTFNFQEYLSTLDKGLLHLLKKKQMSLQSFIRDGSPIDPPSFLSENVHNLKQYLIWGGYPEAIKANTDETRRRILNNIMNLYLDKDISAFFGLTDTSKFEALLRVLAFNIGNMVNISGLSSDLKLSYRQTEHFLEILEHSYTIKLVRPFYKNLVTEVKKMPKQYLFDLGMRNAILNNFTPFDNRTDRGELLENFVFCELQSNFEGWQINYWRTMGKAEMDFILRKDNQIVPIEVKLGGKKLGKGFYSFLKTYHPKRAIVATLDKFNVEKVLDTTVYWVPAYYF